MMIIKIKNKKQILLLLTPFILLATGISVYIYLRPDPPLEEKFVTEEIVIRNVESPFDSLLDINSTGEYSKKDDIQTTEIPTYQPKAPPSTYEIPSSTHTYQTFNNCGPATLSMFLSYFDISVDQETLGNQMRPYQHPKGDNDDKTIFPPEFTEWVAKYGEEKGLNVIYRPNGSLELLKLFISQDIPVVAKTWLNLKEDIGHFIIVRGYNDDKQIVLTDDSYYGPHKKVSYYDFLSLWQPFNYSYVVAYDNSQDEIVRGILGSEMEENIAWQNAVDRAYKEHELVPDNIYPLFNLAVGSYHLGDYEKSIQFFEQVEDRLPRRMLWYQIEPIRSYVETGDYERVFSIIEHILENGNRAFSELYQIRGEIYLEQGEVDKAREEFEQAVYYNKYFEPAKKALENL